MTRRSRKTKTATRKASTKNRVKKFSMKCISDPREVGRLESFLHEVNKTTKLDDGTFYRLLVASTEAVNNAILHGNKNNPKKQVCVECVVGKDSLKVRVQDEGLGFDPESIPSPLEEENLLKTSGRGIFLMRSLMDKVRFRITKKRVRVELEIDLRKLK